MEERKWYSKNDILNKRQGYVDSIDPYINYIDDLRRYKEAQKMNSELSGLIDFCDKVLRQMDEISCQLKEARIITNIEYSKGCFRIQRDKYYYKKMN